MSTKTVTTTSITSSLNRLPAPSQAGDNGSSPSGSSAASAALTTSKKYSRLPPPADDSAPPSPQSHSSSSSSSSSSSHTHDSNNDMMMKQVTALTQKALDSQLQPFMTQLNQQITQALSTIKQHTTNTSSSSSSSSSSPPNPPPSSSSSHKSSKSSLLNALRDSVGGRKKPDKGVRIEDGDDSGPDSPVDDSSSSSSSEDDDSDGDDEDGFDVGLGPASVSGAIMAGMSLDYRLGPAALTVVKLHGGFLKWHDKQMWKNARNKRESHFLAQTLDVLLEEGQVTKKSLAFELLVRRLFGLNSADKTGNWDVVNVLQGLGPEYDLVPYSAMYKIMKKVNKMKKVKSGGSSAAAKSSSSSYYNNSGASSSSSRSSYSSGGGGSDGHVKYGRRGNYYYNNNNNNNNNNNKSSDYKSDNKSASGSDAGGTRKQ
jgi:hypothetical protein